MTRDMATSGFETADGVDVGEAACARSAMRRTRGLTAARRGAVVVVVDATRKLEDQFNALFVFEQLERSGSPLQSAAAIRSCRNPDVTRWMNRYTV